MLGDFPWLPSLSQGLEFLGEGGWYVSSLKLEITSVPWNLA